MNDDYYKQIDECLGRIGKQGGTRKIGDLPKYHKCRHPEHNPPGMIVLPDGLYEHVCPGCGHAQHFTVEKPTL